MAEDRLPVGASGEFLETSTHNDSEGVKVHREVVSVGSNTDKDAKAAVRKNDQGIYALETLSNVDIEIKETLQALLEEMKLNNRYMAHIACIDLRGESGL